MAALDPMGREILEAYKREAEGMGITLQELLSFLILEKLDNLSATVYQGEE